MFISIACSYNSGVMLVIRSLMVEWEYDSFRCQILAGRLGNARD